MQVRAVSPIQDPVSAARPESLRKAGLRDILRNICYRWNPTRRLYLCIRSLVSPAYNGLALERIAQQLQQITKGRIAHGPFAGVWYTRHSAAYLPAMIVGSYESELHPIVEQVIATPYDLIVEAGSAGGYYLIGFLARMPAARAIGFDTDYEMRYVCRKCAERNGVADRLTVYGACTAEALSSLAGDQRIFLICDIEGAEWDLMDPVKIPVLANWDLLVESHECYRPGITRSLIQRFSHTHIVSEIPQRPRVVEDWPVVSSLSALQKALAIEDHSGPKVWLHLKVRKPPSPSVVR